MLAQTGPHALVVGLDGRPLPVAGLVVDKSEVGQAQGRKTYVTVAIPQAAAPDLKLPEGKAEGVEVKAAAPPAAGMSEDGDEELDGTSLGRMDGGICL